MSKRKFIHIVSLITNALEGNKPAYLCNRIKLKSEIQTANLRFTENKICVPFHRTEKFKTSFSYMATYIFNSLPLPYHNLSM